MEKFTKPPEFKVNEKDHRFEWRVGHHFAFIDYKETANQIALIHTESPEALAGTGSAAKLVAQTLAYIEESGKKLLPFCPYVFAYLKKHPEWKRIVAPSFKGYDNI
jgi:predicted GNAT family acetyltransferase